jgi:DNA-binding PadR family transcriptional regulator
MPRTHHPRFDHDVQAHLDRVAAHFAGRGRGPGGHHGPFPGGFGRGFGGPAMAMFRGFAQGGRRMRRGDVRAAILALLAEEPRNGYQIIQEIEKRSEGLWRPSAGAVYPALQQLEDEGLVTATGTSGKRSFSLTEAGTTYATENAEELAAPWDTVAGSVDDSMMGLFQTMRQVWGAAIQVSQAGSEAQLKEAQQILLETRKRLYRLLADSDEAETTES